MGMLAITLQDLRFRWRQFLIAIVGAALVFAMSLLMSGMAAGFSYEIDQTVASLQAQQWIAAAGSSGRVAALSPMPSSVVQEVVAAGDRRRAEPVVVVPQSASVGGQSLSLVLVGVVPGEFAKPVLTAGHQVRRPGQAVVDARLKLGIGRHFRVSGRPFTVVGTVSGDTLLAGIPDVYVPLTDAQAVAFGGRPLVDAVVVAGTPVPVPPGLTSFTVAQVEAASLTAMAAAKSSIDNSKYFSWLIAAVIVAALVYVNALERIRDFAVLKALGSSSASLYFGLAAQAVLVSLIAAAVAAAISRFMTGMFAQPVEIPVSAYLVLPLSAVVVGLLSSLVALRRAVSVDPALAFAGA
jgi:putative ABC transport system permease protein